MDKNRIFFKFRSKRKSSNSPSARKNSSSNEKIQISKDYKRTSSTPTTIDYNYKDKSEFVKNNNSLPDKNFSDTSKVSKGENDDEDLEKFYNKLKKNKVANSRK